LEIKNISLLPQDIRAIFRIPEEENEEMKK